MLRWLCVSVCHCGKVWALQTTTKEALSSPAGVSMSVCGQILSVWWRHSCPGYTHTSSQMYSWGQSKGWGQKRVWSIPWVGEYADMLSCSKDYCALRGMKFNRLAGARLLSHYGVLLNVLIVECVKFYSIIKLQWP